jgi:beta-lactamase class D
MPTARILVFSVLLLLACATAPTPPAASPAAPHAEALAPPSGGPAAAAAPGPVSVTDATRLMELPVQARADLLDVFAEERVSGTIALFDSGTNVLSCSDVERCRRVHVPASTFKIANSIIALETGVVTDPDTVLPWNGTTYTNPDWNQDLTLRAAVRVSCLPCFQGIARKIGEARMREWLARLDYGNQDISGGVDRFWVWGGLRISPIAELDFVRRLDLGKLPIRELTRETVIDLITLDVTEDFVLRGKTGLSGPPDGDELFGWFVGWVERGPRRVYFATALDGYQGEGSGLDGVKNARRRVTERVLQRLGLLPS